MNYHGQITSGFTGSKELIARLKRFAVESRKEMRANLVELGEEKLKLMQERVPYDKGKLHDTGRFSVRVGEKQISLSFTFGGNGVLYARRVHEDLEAQHYGGRRAKYMESVVLETRLGEELAAKFDFKRAAA
jgi:hypothetical protein